VALLAKLRGHIQYYGVSSNSVAVGKFVWEAVGILFKWLNRRSQRKSFTWEQFKRFIASASDPVSAPGWTSDVKTLMRVSR
jgi:hypothetical protein